MPAATTLEVMLSQTPTHLLVHLRGEAGVAAIDEFERHLTRVSATQSTRVIFDLSELTFISSLGLGVLIDCARGLTRRGIIIALAAPQPAVASIFRHCRLDTLFTLHDTVELAAKA